MNVVDRLIEAIGDKNVLHSEQVAGVANGILDPSPMCALAIVYPRTTKDVSAIMKICHDDNQAVVVQGGKSGAVQGHIAKSNEVALSFEKMAAIEDIDTLGRTATVQAGCILQTLQEAVEEKDLLFPVDLGGRGSCTIGGNLSTNAGGERVIRYGMMREQVLGLEVVLADGTIMSSMNEVIKNNTGYDLKHLFIGAEGTLGVVTRVVLRLRQKMSTTNVALLAMNSFAQVLACLQGVDRGLAGQMTAYELMSDNFYQTNTQYLGYSPISESGNYYVVVESQGCDEKNDVEKFETVLADLYERNLIVDAVLAKSQREIDQIWSVRETVESFTSADSYFIYDVSVPMKYMEQYIHNVESAVKAEFPLGECFTVGHVGDGNLHFVVLPNTDTNKASQHKQANDAVYQQLAEFNGSVSAEHGIGIEKKDYLSISRNPVELQLMAALKATLDPQNILGPGRIF